MFPLDQGESLIFVLGFFGRAHRQMLEGGLRFLRERFHPLPWKTRLVDFTGFGRGGKGGTARHFFERWQKPAAVRGGNHDILVGRNGCQRGYEIGGCEALTRNLKGRLVVPAARGMTKQDQPEIFLRNSAGCRHLERCQNTCP